MAGASGASISGTGVGQQKEADGQQGYLLYSTLCTVGVSQQHHTSGFVELGSSNDGVCVAHQSSAGVGGEEDYWS